MKKIFCIFLAVLFSLFSCISFASATSYHVENAGISITIPDNMYVFDRNVSPSDERLSSLGLAYEGLISSFVSQDIYLDALDIDSFAEIVVIAEPTEDKDFSTLSPDGLYNAVISEENSLTQIGRTIVNADLFELGNVDFVKTISKANDTYMQYTTVYNGKKIKIRFTDLEGDFTDEKAESFEAIVETIVFDPLQPVPQTEDVQTQSDSATSDGSTAENEGATEENIDIQNADTAAVPAAMVSSDGQGGGAPFGFLGKIAFIILAAIFVCSIPALIFRYVFAGGGIRKKAAKFFTFFYTVAMTMLFYYIITNHKELNLSLLICLVPILWSFVIYKIVKR